jgi:hypothetical protein
MFLGLEPSFRKSYNDHVSGQIFLEICIKIFILDMTPKLRALGFCLLRYQYTGTSNNIEASAHYNQSTRIESHIRLLVNYSYSRHISVDGSQ